MSATNGTNANDQSTSNVAKSKPGSKSSIHQSPSDVIIVTFYTNHLCPWAHRSQNTLKALGLPYEEVIIPLDRPREQWYLDINPRGLVPSIRISNGILEDEIICESAIISTFLADMYPKDDFYPAPRASPYSSLTRAKINFFVDTFITKVNTLFYPACRAEGKEKDAKGDGIVAAVKKEIEPLLRDAGPFFGGSQELTLAEALTAPFVLRYQTFSELGPMSKNIHEGLEKLPNYSKWSKAIWAKERVTATYDGPFLAKMMARRVDEMKAGAK